MVICVENGTAVSMRGSLIGFESYLGELSLRNPQLIEAMKAGRKFIVELDMEKTSFVITELDER